MYTRNKRPRQSPPPEPHVPDIHRALRIIAALPPALTQRLVLPHSATSAVDKSLCASRLRGYDEAGVLCVYQHEFKMAAIDFDADDDPYVRVSLHEIVTALRTRDGVWLCRTERCEPERAAGHTHSDTGYCITPERYLPAELAALLRPR